MKKIVFVANKLQSGGTEVSLINFLTRMSKMANLDITLILLKREGIYAKNIPENIKVFEVFDEKTIKYMDWFNMKMILKNPKLFFFKIFCKLGIIDKNKFLMKRANIIKAEFDILIDFHGYGYFGTRYAIDVVKAKKKKIFIHDEKMDWINRISDYFFKFDQYLCVSKSCKEKLNQNYPKIKDKVDVCRNIVESEKILSLSTEKIDDNFDENIFNILTIGRLEYQKGYDMLIEIASELKNKNKNFKWYIIGTGSLENELKKLIVKNNLEENVFLLGMKKNPYPYLAQTNLYVQPSRHEGYGLAIAEARVLNKPIISTKLDCVEEQIKNRVTGILCEFDKDLFVKEISNLMDNTSLRNKLSEELKKEKFEVYNEIEKIIGD